MTRRIKPARRETYRLRDDTRRFELWEANVAATLGLGAAARYYRELGIDAVWERVRGLGESLRSTLGELPGVQLTDLGSVRSGIVSFRLAGAEPADIVARLRDQRIHLVASRRSSVTDAAPSRTQLRHGRSSITIA